jgi:hypothetical protein
MILNDLVLDFKKVGVTTDYRSVAILSAIPKRFELLAYRAGTTT